MATTINASTSSGLVESADTSGQLELQSNGTTQLTVSPTGAYGQLKSATAQASTSGTSIDFTGIPSWAKRITVMLAGVSSSGTSNFMIQLGTGSTPTYTASGYVGQVSRQASTDTFVSFSTGFVLQDNTAATDVRSGVINILNITENTWVESGITGISTALSGNNNSSGYVPLAAALTAVRITTVGGTDTFDAGSINIMYEG